MPDTETYIDSNDPATIIAARLNRLQELRGFYDLAVAELDAATEFNDESSRLIDTGWASPKVLKGPRPRRDPRACQEVAPRPARATP